MGLLILIVALVISSINTGDSKPAFGSAIDARAISILLIEKRLKDPDSVKYDDVHIYSMMLDGNKGKMYTVCGKINAKNSLGGYTGFHDFVVTVAFNQDGEELPPSRNVFLEPSPDLLNQSCHNGL